jgi:hypothetical protein
MDILRKRRAEAAVPAPGCFLAAARREKVPA